MIENLICAGAFDALPGIVHKSMKNYLKLWNWQRSKRKMRKQDKWGFLIWHYVRKTISRSVIIFLVQPSEWDKKQKLEKEEEVIGFYLSAHPLDIYKKYLQWFNIASFTKSLQQSLKHDSLQEPIVIGCGFIKTSKTILTKKGEKMAFITLEDTTQMRKLLFSLNFIPRLKNGFHHIPYSL